VSQGTTIIQRKAVKYAANFRYVFLNEDTMQGTGFFQYPLAVYKLGHFVMQAYMQSRPNAKVKPFLVILKRPQRGNTLLVGIQGDQNDTVRNKCHF